MLNFFDMFEIVKNFLATWEPSHSPVAYQSIHDFDMTGLERLSINTFL